MWHKTKIEKKLSDPSSYSLLSYTSLMDCFHHVGDMPL